MHWQQACADEQTIERLLALFVGAEADDMAELFVRVNGGAGAVDKNLLLSIARYSNRLDCWRRARRSDRKTSAAILADHLVWACSVMFSRFERDDPFRQELAHLLGPEAARAEEQVQQTAGQRFA
jgi:hypothetical protein